jgi:hypothetical protein
VQTLLAEALVLGGRPDEALVRTQALLDGAGRPPDTLLLRVHGTALAQLGRSERALFALSSALDSARAGGDAFERLLTLDVFNALDERDGEAQGEHRRELALLVERLSIVKLPPLPLMRAAPPPLRRA